MAMKEHDSRIVRRGCVLTYLTYRKGEWVPGPVLASPEVGGSEGLRRLRELRAQGHPIEKRRVKGKIAWEYRLKGVA